MWPDLRWARRNEVYWGLEAVSPSKEYFGLFLKQQQQLRNCNLCWICSLDFSFYLIYFVNTNFFWDVFLNYLSNVEKLPNSSSINTVCMLSPFSCVWPFSTPWTVACQAPLSLDSLGKNTGVGCHALLQGVFPTQEFNRYLFMSVSGILAGGFFITGAPCGTSNSTKDAVLSRSNITLLWLYFGIALRTWICVHVRGLVIQHNTLVL